MNNAERRQLSRLQQILMEVPFSASGTATSTGYGAIMYEQDMRALRPYISKVIHGIIMQGKSWTLVGEDYEDPDKLLSMLEGWIEKRKAEGWKNAYEQSIRHFQDTWVE